MAAKLAFLGHALMENRCGLVVDACLTQANGYASAMQAGLDIAYSADDIHFTWCGFDEMDEVQGSGSAELHDDGTLTIDFVYNIGDEAVIKAVRVPSSAAC